MLSCSIPDREKRGIFDRDRAAFVAAELAFVPDREVGQVDQGEEVDRMRMTSETSGDPVQLAIDGNRVVAAHRPDPVPGRRFPGEGPPRSKDGDRHWKKSGNPIRD